MSAHGSSLGDHLQGLPRYYRSGDIIRIHVANCCFYGKARTASDSTSASFYFMTIVSEHLLLFQTEEYTAVSIQILLK
jgi:hypothetical protein